MLHKPLQELLPSLNLFFFLVLESVSISKAGSSFILQILILSDMLLNHLSKKRKQPGVGLAVNAGPFNAGFKAGFNAGSHAQVAQAAPAASDVTSETIYEGPWYTVDDDDEQSPSSFVKSSADPVSWRHD